MKDNPLATLAAAIASLAAIVAGFTLSGTMGRILRNEGELLAIAIVLAVIGAIAFISVQWVSDGKKHDRQQLALVFAAFAVLCVVAAGTLVARMKEQPSIDAKITEDGRFLDATVKASNLAADERVAVVVDGLEPAEAESVDTTVLWQGYVGPDSDGNVELPVHARIVPSADARLRIRAWTGDTEAPCEQLGSSATASGLNPKKGRAGTGCVVLPAPRLAERPQVSASFESAGKIVLHVKAGNDPGRIVLYAVGRKKGKTKLIHRSVLQPDGDGVIDAKVTLPIGPKLRRVCAEAHRLGTKGRAAELRLPPCPMKRHAPTGSAVETMVPKA